MMANRAHSLMRNLTRGLKRVSEDSSEIKEAKSAVIESGLFDFEWYLLVNPDVAHSGMNALDHYVRHGGQEMRSPSPHFDRDYYLRKNTDVAATGIDPFVHFIQYGWKEGRLPSPGFDINGYSKAREAGGDVTAFISEISNGSKNPEGSDYDFLNSTGLFDRDYYLSHYPNVAKAKQDPITHYLKYGAKEGRNPSRWFDTNFYLSRYPDVVKAQVNPLCHFCKWGWEELRNPSPQFESGWYWVWHMLPNNPDGNPLIHYLATGVDAPALPALDSEARMSPVDRQALLNRCEELVGSGMLSIASLKRLAMLAQRLGSLALAESALGKVVAQDWTRADSHLELAQVLAKQKKWWLVVESLNAAIAIDAGHPEWFFQLGEACEAMGRFAEATEAYGKALTEFPERSAWHYRLGFMHEKAGNHELAQDAYETAIALDKTDEAKKFGVGVYHQKRGLWDEASKAYLRHSLKNPMSAGLRQRLGMTYDRLYRWSDAAEQYRNAIALSAATPQPGWHYRLGFVYERMEQWDSASIAYATAIALSEKHTAYWNYRLGYVLERAGHYRRACMAYANTRAVQKLEPPRGHLLPSALQQVDLEILPLENEAVVPYEILERHLGGFSKAGLLRESIAGDMTLPEPHYRLGESLEHQGDWSGASQSYRAALDRSSEFKSYWFYRLGYVLALEERFEEACLAYRQTRMLQRPHGQSEEILTKNIDLRISTSYVEYTEMLPIRADVIVYESFNGNSMTCNPLALFRDLLEHPVYGTYLHVWVLNDSERIPPKYRHLPNVVFVSKGSDGYLRYLATAKYLINNSGFPPYFIRRQEQKYLATWHGTPLKTLGKEQKYKFYDHKRTQRNFLQSTHIISPNKHTSDIQLDSYDIRPLYTGMFAETGYPRIDLTLNATAEERESIRARMGLSTDRPVVLYAPTWRGTLDNVVFDTSRLEHDLSVLAGLDCQVLFRGHSLLERVLREDDIACQVVPADIDTNELLSIVDVLITDYSSIFFDFLATGRPVLYYIYDVESYEEERGLYFSMDDMPGIKCHTIEELRDGVSTAIRGEQFEVEHYRASQASYNYRDDGRATQRVIEFFFEDSEEYSLSFRGEAKPTMIINAGSFQPNGITASAINLVRAIDREKINVVVAFAPNVMETMPDYMSQFRKLPADIYAIPRYGSMPMTLEERWIRKHQEDRTIPLSNEAWGILNVAYGREFKRIFGDKEYESAVAFSGYDAFWASIMFINNSSMKKVIYLHNDMHSEHVCKYPELGRMFDIYKYADELVSVSDKTNKLNTENLLAWSGGNADRFVHCDNIINSEEIVIRASEGLEVTEESALFDGSNKVFINIGRLSVEKDQQKLIEAFSIVAAEHADARLLILGDGPLRSNLEGLASSLGLSDRIHILGYRRNPYSYLNSANCFVLSSNHEGQPMTLLESLVLSKPVVATDIVGNRSVMEGRGGLLVENSVDGLANGMLEFIDGRVETKPFDWRSYNRNAIDQFYRTVFA